MTQNAYVHIPFCKSKCKYCSFVSFNRLDLMAVYTSALLKDIEKNYHGEKLKTLYLGGGTPSLLPLDLLEKIIKCFNLQKEYELTIEINPNDVTKEYFRSLFELGINRLSIGSQTFDDKILKLIGRRHNSEQIVQTVDFAKQAGFENISVDLIYGLPTQTMEGLEKDLEKFLSLDIQHISTYGLKIEAESYWGKYYDNKTNQLVVPNQTDYIYPPDDNHLVGSNQTDYIYPPDDDEQADMYEGINNLLEANGFYRYEISNFAKKGFESKHNLNYWNNDEYYGFGTAAHGYINGVRYSNFSTLKEYIDKPTIREHEKQLTEKEKLEEDIFLGFRKRSGVNIERIKQRYGVDFGVKYKSILDKYSDYIEKTPSGYTLNLKGVLISNLILAEFI